MDLAILFKFLIGHAIADFALQSDWIAKNKSYRFKPDYIPEGQKPNVIWPYVLSAHSLIHAGAVLFISGSVMLAVVEFIVHWLIDFAKCANWTNIHQDQWLHIICKIFYSF